MRAFFNCATLAGACALALWPAVSTAAPSLLEITQGGQKYEGMLEAKGSKECWILGRDGRLSAFEIDRIDSIRTVAPRFREYSFAELRDQLRREMPNHFRIDGTGHFLVCAEKNNRRFGEICEETYRTFRRYFSVRGFKISEPQFPLVVIVFPDRAKFVTYCRKDGINPPSEMLGYYMRLTNRVALFDTGEGIGRSAAAMPESDSSRSLASLLTAAGPTKVRALPFDRVAASPPSLRYDAVVEANLQNTIVHETTHQVAFNTGLHSRIGQTPKWVIEGLATMFEAPGIRNSAKNASAKSRINRSRFIWFANFAKSRREPRSLEKFIATDDLFSSATLDAYAEGWALTFFLTETRHGSYVRFLKTIAHRDSLARYTADQRVSDFRRSFGEIKSLEAEYLRFMENLK